MINTFHLDIAIDNEAYFLRLWAPEDLDATGVS